MIPYNSRNLIYSLTVIIILSFIVGFYHGFDNKDKILAQATICPAGCVPAPPTPTPTPTPSPTPTPVPTPTPTPPAGGTPVLDKIFAGPPNTAGKSVVTGIAGSVTNSSTVVVTNSSVASTATVAASADGSFSVEATAQVGHILSIKANNGPATTLKVFSPLTLSVNLAISLPAKVVMTGMYAYVADNAGLRIINYGTPSNPVIIGSLLTELPASGLVRKGNYIFLTHGFGLSTTYGLSIIDVSNNTDPKLVGQLFLGSGLTSIAINSAATKIFVAGYISGTYKLQIVDVTNPLSPIIQGSIISSTSNSPRSIISSGNYLYAATEGTLGGVKIFDVSNSSSPAIAASPINNSAAFNLALVPTNYGNVLAVTTSAGFKLINVSTPSAPALPVTFFSNVTTFNDVVWGGGSNILISLGYPVSGMKIYNIVNPNNPVDSGTISTASQAGILSFDTGRNLAFLNADQSLKCIDTVSKVVVANISSAAGGADLDIKGVKQVVVVNQVYQNAIHLMDYTNSTKPVTVWTLIQPGVSTAVAFSSDGLYVLSGNLNEGQFQVISVATGQIVGRIPYPTWPAGGNIRDIECKNNIAYVAATFEGIIAVDISIPTAPRIIGKLKIPNFLPKEIEVSGNYIYIAGGAKGPITVNITNPANMIITDIASTAPSIVDSGIVLDGTKLYVSYADISNSSLCGVISYDLINPSVPVKMSTLPINGTLPSKMTVSGKTLFFINGLTTGAFIYGVDIRNPTSLVFKSGDVFKTPRTVQNIKAVGNLFYFVDYYVLGGVIRISP